jgi:hypothetical protein
VLQVRKTSSSNGTYLCSMQGNACERWTLGVMFPPGYRVSNCKQGYRQFNAKKCPFISFSLLDVKKGVNLCQIDVF